MKTSRSSITPRSPFTGIFLEIRCIFFYPFILRRVFQVLSCIRYFRKVAAPCHSPPFDVHEVVPLPCKSCGASASCFFFSFCLSGLDHEDFVCESLEELLPFLRPPLMVLRHSCIVDGCSLSTLSLCFSFFPPTPFFELFLSRSHLRRAASTLPLSPQSSSKNFFNFLNIFSTPSTVVFLTEKTNVLAFFLSCPC